MGNAFTATASEADLSTTATPLNVVRVLNDCILRMAYFSGEERLTIRDFNGFAIHESGRGGCDGECEGRDGWI